MMVSFYSLRIKFSITKDTGFILNKIYNCINVPTINYPGAPDLPLRMTKKTSSQCDISQIRAGVTSVVCGYWETSQLCWSTPLWSHEQDRLWKPTGGGKAHRKRHLLKCPWANKNAISLCTWRYSFFQLLLNHIKEALYKEQFPSLDVQRMQDRKAKWFSHGFMLITWELSSRLLPSILLLHLTKLKFH